MRLRFSICTGSQCIFTIGFFVGILLAVLVLKTDHLQQLKTSCPSKKATLIKHYNEWFYTKRLSRFNVDNDEFVYGRGGMSLEADFLFEEVKVTCAVFVRKFKNAEAIKNTWGRHCNKAVFFGLRNDDNIPVIHFKPKNSFHFLCESIQHIWKEYGDEVQWVLFVPDDIFVIPENLRYYVAPLDHTTPYYLGHPLMLWGQFYNVGQAGYVLSKGAIEALQVKFNTTEKCRDGGKYWRNEDLYLGKHLGNLGISPRDTRDEGGRSRFHGYNLNQLLFPGRLSSLSSYWKRSVYPVIEGLGCCSNRAITFHGIEVDKLYMYDYLLNHLRVFHHGGHIGNQPAPTPVPEDEVWQDFLIQEGKGNRSISSDEFFNLWQNKISAPDTFNERMRQEHLVSVSATATGFANMPHVLESMLNAIHANESENEV